MTDGDADKVPDAARRRADPLLDAVRFASDARLPLTEQTKATVALLIGKREEENRSLIVPEHPIPLASARPTMVNVRTAAFTRDPTPVAP